MFKNYNRLTFFCAVVLLLSAACTVPPVLARPEKETLIQERNFICGDFALPSDNTQKNLFLNYYNYLISRPDLLILLDKTYSLPPEYEPEDLKVIKGSYKLREEAADYFLQMAGDAKKDNMTLTPFSAYRSYEYQKYIYERSKRLRGQDHTDKYIAAPGHSQHQLGLAVDINSVQLSFEKTKEFAWLTENAGKYGYSLSFPENAEQKTGFFYEPWHYRDVTPQGAKMQELFFNGSQHDMLSFFHKCAAQK